MINPNGDDFVEDEPLAASGEVPVGGSSTNLRTDDAGAWKISAAAGDTWKQAKQKAGNARAQTEIFVRENPVPIIVSALALGIIAGWALRHATMRDEKQIEVKSPLGDFNWSFLSLPVLWPFLKSMKHKYADSAETLKERVRDGVE